jgi:alpha-D-xyloside xylohydrolase
MRLPIVALALTFILSPAFGRAAAPVHRVPNGVVLKAGGETVKVQFTAPGIVRVLKWTSGGTPAKVSLSVVEKPAKKLHLRFRQTASAVTLDSGKIKLLLDKRDGSVRFLARDGHTILEERGAARFAPTDLPREKSAFSVGQAFKLTPDEGIYGLGQHQSGEMDWRGKTVDLVQANTAAVTPFFVSTAGYGLLWDNYSKTVFADNPETTSLWSEVADNVDYYFIAGPSMDQVIAGYRKLTGPAPMYGRWAYGYWQSKEHYATQDEVLAIAKKYRDLRIPIDNIVQDWAYWGGNDMWGAMVFDPTRYPRPREMVDQLHRDNFHLMISIWPALGPTSEIYKDMDARGFLYPTVGWAGFKYFDAYNPAADDLYWQYLKKGLLSTGIDAWWIDSTEPDVVNALTKESEEFELKRMADNHLGTFARYLNPYSLAITEPLYRHLREENADKRVFILTRSTFAGQQRAAATTWSGDIGADWGVYAAQIPAGINLSMAGIPYWTFDIGAYSLGCQGGVFSNGGKDPGYQELYTRMFQLGAFSPIFRSHGSETPREIWEFGQFSPVLAEFDNLRYRLLPYIYSLAWQVTHNGYSIMRGLPMDFGADHKTYTIGDQYMFGPAIMVSPVTQPMYHRAPEDSVLIGPENFRTNDGKHGLDAKYYCDDQWQTLCHEAVEPDINLFWYTGWPSFITGPKFSMRWEGKLVVAKTGTYRFNMKSFGPRKVYLDGKEIAHNYDSMASWTVPVQLEAGKEYAFKFETANAVLGAFRSQVYWKTPEILARDAEPLPPTPKTRIVYLPNGTSWTDFWTGERLEGGESVTADAPIDKIPLMVKAGSILPMGPFLQYATEKPANPIELRIYAGADGNFTLYEDENDTYDYEKGVYATIAFHWNDAEHRLTIDPRKGKFPTMLKTRTFRVVLVGKNHGTGIGTTINPDKVVSYDGKGQSFILAR